MGAGTDADIEAFQEAAGIKPATGFVRRQLEEMAEAAFQLIQVIELEKCGIRDGDGQWHGSDPLAGGVDDIVRLMESIGRPSAADRSPNFAEFVSDGIVETFVRGMEERQGGAT
jgi:hypothetical protein